MLTLRLKRDVNVPVSRLVLKASSGTHIYFDSETAAGKEEFELSPLQMTGDGTDQTASLLKLVDTELPRSLAEIVGNTYTFQLKLKDFNFTSKHQTFTISGVFPSRELAPVPAFVVNVPEASQPEVVATGSDVKVDNTCSVTEAPSTSDGSLAGRTESAIFIRFSEQSVFYEVAETNEPIQKESFRFRKYDELMSLANTDTKTHLLASINYLKKVCGFDEGSSSAPTKYNGVKKIESIPLSELKSHVLTASPEMYMTAEFVAFDSEMTRFTNVNVIHSSVRANEDDQDIQELALPQSLPSQPLPIQLLIKTSELHSVPHL
ncbi:hypothetical protein F2Q70_00041309 [Brassica cretica]|uniref:Uncharacterized protein n=1 Tax=Brassica cretica TaxID=69181 RepID=A0A8S9K5U0_BRACR|nr:hypothetical protein F2Q70_00041309 [Brassica cretica]